MPSVGVTLLTIVILVCGILYQVYLSPLLVLFGWGRAIKPLNTEKCMNVEGLQACEKLVVHPSGLVYLACASTLESRIDWMPAAFKLNASALRDRTSTDYVTTYDPRTQTVTRLDAFGLDDPRGLNLHGFDVVADEVDSNTLWIYLINHRPPIDPSVDAHHTGADPAIEIFKTRLGSSTMEWVRTLEDSDVIISPNDVVGGRNGKEVWFTNDRRARTGVVRALTDLLFRVKSTTVGYCHADTGCKIAADELYASNGLARTEDGNFWVASTYGAYITIHERQADNSLVPTEVVKVGLPIDNLAASSDGSVIAATFPKLFDLVNAGRNVNPSVTAHSSVYRISLNTGSGSYYGEKYKVEKVYEDNEGFGSSATSAAIYGDTLYLHGYFAYWLRVCKLPGS